MGTPLEEELDPGRGPLYCVFRNSGATYTGWHKVTTVSAVHLLCCAGAGVYIAAHKVSLFGSIVASFRKTSRVAAAPTLVVVALPRRSLN